MLTGPGRTSDNIVEIRCDNTRADSLSLRQAAIELLKASLGTFCHAFYFHLVEPTPDLLLRRQWWSPGFCRHELCLCMPLVGLVLWPFVPIAYRAIPVTKGQKASP